MVDFSDFDEARRWFDAQSPEVSVAMAARAALRVLPLLGTSTRRRAAVRYRATVILPCFRATITPWVATRFPTYGVELRAAANAANAAVDAAGNAGGYDVACAVAYAADAAADDDNTAAARAAGYAAAIEAAAADADAASIKPGFGDAVALLQQPLWLVTIPAPITTAWLEMKRGLLDAREAWDVWTQWYDALLAGMPPVDAAPALAYVTLPEKLWRAGPKAANAEIKRRLAELREKSEPPAEPIPAQGVGPQFNLGLSGKIELAPASEFDAEGNNLARLAELLPLVRQAADDVVKSVNRNVYPELARDAAAYRGALAGDTQVIPWGVVFGRGVLLENAATAAQRQIDDRLSPPLEDAPQAALASLLALHGPLVLATATGRELHEQATSLQMTRDEQAQLRAEAQALATTLEQTPEIIAPGDAAIVTAAADAIGGGRHPESGTVYGSATIKHVTIILVSAAVIGAPVAVVGLAGAPLSWVGYEALKRTSFYKEATGALGTQFEEAVERGDEAARQQAIRLAPFRRFVTRNEVPLRQIATTMPQSRWMLRYIDFIIRTNSQSMT